MTTTYICKSCNQECTPTKSEPEYWQGGSTFIVSDCCEDFILMNGVEMTPGDYDNYDYDMRY